MNEAEVRAAVRQAIDSLAGETPQLDFHAVHERSTAHRLAVHLEERFGGWNIDCEYDRHGEARKELEGINACSKQRETDFILPDIIAHHRGLRGQEHNLLVIEIKKDAERDTCDFAKLRLFTSTESNYAYQFGLYINLNHGQFQLVWFKDGDVIE